MEVLGGGGCGMANGIRGLSFVETEREVEVGSAQRRLRRLGEGK